MTSNYHSLLSFAALATTFSIILLCSFSPIEALNGGFSLDLIHRDSPNSPFYNASETRSQRVSKALRRSINRVNRFKPTCSVSHNSLQSDLIFDSGAYLLSYSVGTPPVPKVAVADTGSDLIWVQCKPCAKCYNQTAPFFDPKKSTTYKRISCTSSNCESSDIVGTSCSKSRKNCLYSVSYGDKSFSKGDLAVETITLGSTAGHPVRLRKTIIGCGHNNNDTTGIDASTGIVGLGAGKFSLVSQLRSSIGGKFSYCLAGPFNNVKSKLNFGSHAVVSGFGTVSTPLVLHKRPNSYYYVTLEAMSVGKKRLKLRGSSASGGSKGNIMIDSGSDFTSFPTEFYSKFKSAVAKEINFKSLDDPHHLDRLCYNSSDDIQYVPSITAHFSGADVKLDPTTTFDLSTDEIACLAFVAGDELSIFGNFAQYNLLIGYDLVKKTVSFKPTDCTKL